MKNIFIFALIISTTASSFAQQAAKIEVDTEQVMNVLFESAPKLELKGAGSENTSVVKIITPLGEELASDNAASILVDSERQESKYRHLSLDCDALNASAASCVLLMQHKPSGETKLKFNVIMNDKGVASRISGNRVNLETKK